MVANDKALYPTDEVFSDSHPGKILKGLRVREGIATQAQLSEKTGLTTRHLSEMENGKRVIGKAMAKRLAAALNASYKMLL
jgi:transcriptional regulator with XRE-family HTH domain